MAIEFSCPKGHKLSAAEKYSGKRIRCPKCQAEVKVPSATPLTDVKLDVAPPPRPSGPPKLPPTLPPVMKDKSPQLEPAVEPAPIETPPLASATISPPPIKSEATPPGLALAVAAAVAVPPPAPPSPPPVKSPSIAEQPALPKTTKSKSVEPDWSEPSERRLLGYRAEAHHAQSVYWLAGGIVLLAIFHAVPALKFDGLSGGPDWTRMVLLLAVIEIAFAVWVALVPDWSTVWSTMLMLAGMATLYGVALGLVVVTPRDRELMLGLEHVRDQARLWCCAVILVTSLVTYICGRLSHGWHKAFLRTLA